MQGLGMYRGVGEYLYPPPPLDMGPGIPTLPSPVLKLSFDHHNTYGQQMGGTHPPGMLFC